MRKFGLIIMLSLILSAFVGLNTTHVQAAPLLQSGATGQSVFQLQLSLFQLGFLTVMPTGTFDAQTKEAVKQFQASQGLATDGAVGNQTWQRLEAVFSAAPKQIHVVKSGDTLWSISRKYNVTVFMLTQANQISDANKLKEGQKLIIPVPSKGTLATSAEKTDAQKGREVAARLAPTMLKWTEVDRIFPEKMVARIVDVDTGRSFRVRRLYGHNHADVEPLTAEDTAILKALYGGKWSWERRAVVVEVAGKRIAGSINGYPHGGDTISNNNFAGHICVHFLGSRTHGTSRVDPDHQAAIKKAAESGAQSVIVH